MIILKVNYEKLVEDYPKEVEAFLTDLRNSHSKSKDTPIEKIEWIVSWGFFGKKAKNDEEKASKQEAYMNKMSLQYEDRLNLDIPKIKVNISLRAGNYARVDRVDGVSESIVNIAKEIIKFQMHEEQKHFNDPVVMSSLPPLDLKEEGGDGEVGIDLSSPDALDSILDKISTDGMTSLTKNELQFLERNSRKTT
jgi:hypothetical protein